MNQNNVISVDTPLECYTDKSLFQFLFPKRQEGIEFWPQNFIILIFAALKYFCGKKNVK